MQEYKIIILGKKKKIYVTFTGHYCIKLDNKFSNKSNFKTNKIFLSNNTRKLSSLEKYKIASKLHNFFTNTAIDCDVTDNEIKSDITDLDKKCEICIKGLFI